MSDIAANRDSRATLDASVGRTPAEIERDLGIGTLVDLRLLNAGPAASLFRARQVATQRAVAVKVLHDELSSDTGLRFDRERAITGQLSGHTGIVPLFDTGTTADGEPYLVSPYYARGSLADLTDRYGPLPWQEAVFLLEPVAVTLAEVHGRKLVHRNVKPGNILLTDFLLPRVADFGMALPLDQQSTPATLIVDSPYGAPEATEPSPAEATIDVYGLGATLWGLLAGRAPELPSTDRRRPVDGEQSPADLPTPLPSPPSDAAPEPIVDLIRRSMAADPAERPANAAAFVSELRTAVGQAGPVANPATQAVALSGAPAVAAPSEPPTERPAKSEPDPASASVPAKLRASSELYLLVLASLIITGVLLMVAAAMIIR